MPAPSGPAPPATPLDHRRPQRLDRAAPRTRPKCATSGPLSRAGSTVTRSFAPFFRRTQTSPRSTCTSFTRNASASIRRNPAPYNSMATSHGSPSNLPSTRATSPGDNTTGMRRGPLARTRPRMSPSGDRNTSR